jgi:hypothetical protein
MRTDGQHIVATVEDALDLWVLEAQLVTVALKRLVVGRTDQHALRLEGEGLGRTADALDDIKYQL